MSSGGAGSAVRRAVALLVVALVTAGAAFAGGVAYTRAHPRAVCIVVHANGAPAPAACTDPQSYQVNG